jgi:hypothetical protein
MKFPNGHSLMYLHHDTTTESGQGSHTYYVDGHEMTSTPNDRQRR